MIEASDGEVELIDSLAQIAARYDVVLCDVWGCYHNGVAPYPAATAAHRTRRLGGSSTMRAVW